MEFRELQTQVFDLYEKGQYSEIINVLEREGGNFPDQARGMSYWWLCVYALSGRTDDAIQTLHDALSRGWWYTESALRTDDDLKSLQGLPVFEELVKQSAALYEEAKKGIKPYQIISLPNEKDAPPLVMALHGNNANAQSGEAFWSPLLEKGYGLSLPQSTLPGNRDNAYVWDDYAIAKQDIEHYYDELPAINKDRLIFGGFSMGGQTAVRLALEGKFGAKGFISVAGWMGNDPELKYIQELLQSEIAKKIRGVIIIGDKDGGSYKGALKLAELLSGAGISHQLTVLRDWGHTYPENYGEILARAAEFILS